MKIAIVNYGVGNIMSIEHCLDRLGISHNYTSDPYEILSSNKVIFEQCKQFYIKMTWIIVLIFPM